MKHHQHLFAIIFSLAISFSAHAGILPDFYQEPGFQAHRVPQYGFFGETIDPFHGGLQIDIAEFYIPGNNQLDIAVDHVYQSGHVPPGYVNVSSLMDPSAFGYGWDVHLGRVWVGAYGCGGGSIESESPILELPDGSRQALLVDNAHPGFQLITKSRWVARCLSDSNGNSGYVVTSPQGVKYFFDQPAHPVSLGRDSAYQVRRIEDANGNAINVEYFTNTYYQLVSRIYLANDATASISLSYANYSTASPHNQFWLLQSITGSKGQKWSYQYTPMMFGSSLQVGYYFLTKIRPPGMPDWNLSYFDAGAGVSNLKTITTPGGTDTSFTYATAQFDSSFSSLQNVVVATKTVQNGGVTSGVWSYAYEPGSGSVADQTTIIGPSRREVYRHKGARDVVDGDVWRIGTLQSMDIYPLGSSTALQSTQFIWEKDFISPQIVERRRSSQGSSKATDSAAWSPRLRQKTIMRNGLNYVTSFNSYDAFGNPLVMVENGFDGSSAVSKTTSYAYDIKSTLWRIHLPPTTETINDVRGNIARTFNALGDLIEENHYGVSTRFERCTTSDKGEIKTRTDANGHVTSYTCGSYKFGIPTGEVRGAGSVQSVSISRAVNRDGTLASENIGGQSTSYSWDNLSRLTGITTPRLDDSNINFNWSLSGRTKTLTRGGLQQEFAYDGLGRVTQTVTAGLTQKLTYDAVGRKTFVLNLGDISNGTSFSYDALDRVTVQNPPGAGEINVEYRGNTIKTTDQRGSVTTKTFRSFGDPDKIELTRIESPAGIDTSMPRDLLGNIDYVSQSGITRNYTYNSRYQLIALTSPEIGGSDQAVYFERDALGNMTSRKIGATGAVTRYQYDAHNRLQLIDYADAAVGDIAYTYNPRNKILSVERLGQSKWNYDYNANDVLTAERFLTTVDGAQNFNFSYALDALDHVTNLSYPSGRAYAVSSDVLGRVTAIGGVVASADYFASGQLKTLRFQNGKTVSYGQNSQQLVASVRADSIINTDYQYDGKGNLVAMLDNQNSLNSLNPIGYDGLDRLVNLNNAATFAYDSRNNITRNNLSNRNYLYNYDARNRLASVSNSSYLLSYDERGNVTNNGTHQFVFDEANNLKQITNLNQQYAYDANQYRFRKNISGGYQYALYDINGLLKYEKMAGNQVDGQRDYLYLGTQLIARMDYCGNLDGDGDGVSSCDELAAGFNPQDASDGQQDDDGDGLTNADELNRGLNIRSSDSDGDGIPDGYEVANGYNADNAADAASDDDGDTLTLRQEYQLNTNPRNADSDNDGLADNVDPLPSFNPAILPAVYFSLGL